MSAEPKTDPFHADARGDRQMLLRTAVVVSVLAAAGGTAYAITRPPKPPATPPPTLVAHGDAVTLTEGAPQWKYIELGTAAAAPALVPLPAPGRVEFDPRRTALVQSPLAGRVEQVVVRPGDHVNAHDRLFSVRSGAFADLERELETAREEVAVKTRSAERLRALVGVNAAAEKDAQLAEAELHEAQAELKAAEAKRASLKVAGEGSNLFWVTSPRAGTVVELGVVESEEVAPEKEGDGVRVSDIDELLVNADVPEADAADLQVGAAVMVKGQSLDLKRQGVVEHVSEVVDPHRRTVEVRVRLDNHDRAFRPNGYVEVALVPSDRLQRVRVPSAAVVTDGERAVVFVEKKLGLLERVPVVAGRERDGELEVVSGLAPGTRYVKKGALLLLNEISLAE